MPIVKTDVPMTAGLCDQIILELVNTYPYCRSEILTTSAYDHPIRTLVIGNGPRKVLYTAAHHANEWITAPVILKFVEDFAIAIQSGGRIGDAIVISAPKKSASRGDHACIIPGMGVAALPRREQIHVACRGNIVAVRSAGVTVAQKAAASPVQSTAAMRTDKKRAEIHKNLTKRQVM